MRDNNFAKVQMKLASMKSEAKAEAARANGRLGGRPRKDGLPPAGQPYARAVGGANRLTDLLAQFEHVNRKLIDLKSAAALKAAIEALDRLRKHWSKELE